MSELRRVMAVRVSAGIIADMLSPTFPGAWYRTDFGLPAGARCVGRCYDIATDDFWFQFEHESFPEHQPGERIPEFRGIEVSAFHFESPLSDQEIAQLNRLTEAQIERETRRQNGETPTPYDKSDLIGRPPFESRVKYTIRNENGEETFDCTPSVVVNPPIATGS